MDVNVDVVRGIFDFIIHFFIFFIFFIFLGCLGTAQTTPYPVEPQPPLIIFNNLPLSTTILSPSPPIPPITKLI